MMMIDFAAGTMNRWMFSGLLKGPNPSLTPFRRLLSSLSLILVLIISASCEMPGDTTPGEAANANYGYANSSFRYFYYPEDKKIYYISGDAVHRMDVDGTNSAVIKSNLWKNPPKDASSLYPFIYVSSGTVYYNDRRENTTYKMNTDGTEHAVERSGESGPMGVYGTGTNAKLYFFDGRQQYRKNAAHYFSQGRFDNLSNLSKRTLPGGSVTALTNGQADNFVFAPEGIYFRLKAAAAGVAGAYGIVKVGYDAPPEGSGAAARLKNTDMRKVVDPDTPGAGYPASSPNVVSLTGGPVGITNYVFSTLNVSKDFIAYIGRSIDNRGGTSHLLPGGLNVVIRGTGPDGADRYTSPRTLRTGIRKFDLAGGGIDIIGDYMYWLTEDEDNKRYRLHRIKKDGTGYGIVKHLRY